jgi:hypothetical protein
MSTNWEISNYISRGNSGSCDDCKKEGSGHRMIRTPRTVPDIETGDCFDYKFVCKECLKNY